MKSVLWADRVCQFHEIWKRLLVIAAVVGPVVIVLHTYFDLSVKWYLPFFCVGLTQFFIFQPCPLREMERALRDEGLGYRKLLWLGARSLAAVTASLTACYLIWRY